MGILMIANDNNVSEISIEKNSYICKRVEKITFVH